MKTCDQNYIDSVYFASIYMQHMFFGYYTSYPTTNPLFPPWFINLFVFAIFYVCNEKGTNWTIYVWWKLGVKVFTGRNPCQSRKTSFTCSKSFTDLPFLVSMGHTVKWAHRMMQKWFKSDQTMACEMMCKSTIETNKNYPQKNRR